MCGIVGFCTKNNNVIKNKDIITNMLNKIVHRGPDDDGVSFFESKSNGLVGFGHKRLSIIDLSSNGHQPMEYCNGRYSIIFNGEIYNYKELRKDLRTEGFSFHTESDTEVILAMYHKYKEKSCSYLNGMFAFAIYDKEEDSIFIARDRLGIRPLYYYCDNESFVFGSEIKSILEYPSVQININYPTMFQYVQHRYVNNPETLFDGINKLQPGCFMKIKGLEYSIKRYWDVDDFERNKYSSMQESINELGHTLENSVKLRMISDVPFGAFLSGGIDSSLIVAMMSKYSNNQIKTYSVGFKEAKFSELPYAKTIANKFNTDHHELIISYKDVIENIYNTVWHRDAPVSEASDIPIYLLSKEAKKTVSVILTGEGSDEIFAGYPKYAYDRFSKSIIFNTLFNNGVVSKTVNSLPYKYRKLKLAYNTIREKEDIKRYGNWFSSFRENQVNSIFDSEFLNENRKVDTEKFDLHGNTNLNKMMYYDLKNWLTDNLLERGDKMLMSASVEGRVPFLDHNVVELAFQINDKYKIKNFNRKYIVKKLAEKYIPKENIYRKKVGFYIPVGEWFRNDLKNMIGDHLLSSRFKDRNIFNSIQIEKIVNDHINGVYNYEKEIWMLLNLEVWMRTFIDKNI